VLITEEQYNTNKNNLGILNQTPFTRIFVFYNHGHDNPHRYNISGRLGGRHELIIYNPTDLDVELRLNSPHGETIGFAPRRGVATSLYLSDASQTPVFPVFRFFHPVHHVVSEIFPTIQSGPLAGNSWFMPYDTSPASPPLRETLNIETVRNAAAGMSLGATWLLIENRASIPSISFMQGSTPLSDTMGGLSFRANTDRVISFDMRGVGNTVLPNRVVTNLWIGPVAGAQIAAVEDENGNRSFTLLPDRQYRILITGSHLDGTLTARINLNGIQVNFNDLLQDQ
jgi:hypothetical protein